MNDDFQTKAETGRRLLDTLAGLRLTVTLLILSILLVFLGTLEQVHWGVWHIQKAYFGSWVCFYPLDDTAVARIPLPGGFLLGALGFEQGAEGQHVIAADHGAGWRVNGHQLAQPVARRGDAVAQELVIGHGGGGG